MWFVRFQNPSWRSASRHNAIFFARKNAPIKQHRLPQDECAMYYFSIYLYRQFSIGAASSLCVRNYIINRKGLSCIYIVSYSLLLMNSAPLDPQHIINHPNSENSVLEWKLRVKTPPKPRFFYWRLTSLFFCSVLYWTLGSLKIELLCHYRPELKMIKY